MTAYTPIKKSGGKYPREDVENSSTPVGKLCPICQQPFKHGEKAYRLTREYTIFRGDDDVWVIHRDCDPRPQVVAVREATLIMLVDRHDLYGQPCAICHKPFVQPLRAVMETKEGEIVHKMCLTDRAKR